MKTESNINGNNNKNINNIERKNFFSHPVFGAGFRPFFSLAFVSGIIFPVIWAWQFLHQSSFFISLVQTNDIPNASPFFVLNESILAPQIWHAHEMLYGFGWAVLGGFLLTASKNWVHIRGIFGGPLVFLSATWILERIYIFFGKNIPFLTENSILNWIFFNVFLIGIGIYILTTLIVHRKNDTFKDNFFFIIAIPLFMYAKNLFLSWDSYSVGVNLTIGLFRLAFAVMFERTITQFMKNAFGIDLIRNSFLDYSIKFLILLLALQSLFPFKIASELWALIYLATCGLLLFRWLMWKPLKGLSNFGISLMYIGYLGMVIHLAVNGIQMLGFLKTFIGAWSIHAFTFICMGTVIPGMMIRISQGHTGRKFQFTKSDKLGFAFMALATLFRLVFSQFMFLDYNFWIFLSGICWAIAFAIIGLRVVGFMWKPRQDGKPG